MRMVPIINIKVSVGINATRQSEHIVAHGETFDDAKNANCAGRCARNVLVAQTR